MATPEHSKQFMLTYYLMLYSIFYYDWVTTLQSEYRRIWRANWTPVKAVFLLNRYLTMLESIFIFVGFTLSWSQSKCERFFIPWQTFLPVLISAAGGTLLLLRTWAIWGRARWVLWTLAVLLALQVAGGTVLAATQVESLPFSGDIGPCMTYASNKIMDLYCVLPIIYDAVASALCIYRTCSLGRQFEGLSTPLLVAFQRHGIYYIGGITAVNAANLIFMTVATKVIGLPTVPSNGGLLCTVLASILVSRLALSLKSDASRTSTHSHVLPMSAGSSDLCKRYSAATECSMSAAPMKPYAGVQVIIDQAISVDREQPAGKV